jgi:hypothetical protein
MSGGTDPGLNLFEKAEDLPGPWERIKSLFTVPGANGEDEGDGYEDQSGAGSGWQPPRGAGAGEGGNANGAAGGGEFELDEVDDLLETAVILVTMLGIGCLIWLRQRWGIIQGGVDGGIIRIAGGG